MTGTALSISRTASCGTGKENKTATQQSRHQHNPSYCGINDPLPIPSIIAEKSGCSSNRGKLGATIHAHCHGDYGGGSSIPLLCVYVRQVPSRSYLTLRGGQEDVITFPAPSAYMGWVKRQLTISLVSSAMRAVYIQIHAQRGAVVNKTEDYRLRGLRSAPAPLSYPKKHQNLRGMPRILTMLPLPPPAGIADKTLLAYASFVDVDPHPTPPTKTGLPWEWQCRNKRFFSLSRIKTVCDPSERTL